MTKRIDKPASAIAFLIIFAVVIAGPLWYGYLVMLAMGIIHGFAHGWPAIGYWLSCAVGLLLTALTVRAVHED